MWSPQFPKALVLTEELRPLKKAGPAPTGTALAPRLSTPVPQMALGQKSQEELNIYPMDCPVRLVQVGIAGKDGIRQYIVFTCNILGLKHELQAQVPGLQIQLQWKPVKDKRDR